MIAQVKESLADQLEEYRLIRMVSEVVVVNDALQVVNRAVGVINRTH